MRTFSLRYDRPGLRRRARPLLVGAASVLDLFGAGFERSRCSSNLTGFERPSAEDSLAADIDAIAGDFWRAIGQVERETRDDG